MKFKEQKGNVFVFTRKGIFKGEYIENELELVRYDNHPRGVFYSFKNKIAIASNLKAGTIQEMDTVNFYDIQTAVNLMQILIKEGLV